MRLFIALTLLLLPAAASARSMIAEVFHKGATALKKKGPLALFSRGEIRALMEEGGRAGLKVREQRLAAVKAGGKPRFCPPEGKHTLGSDEFMKRLGAISQAERAKIDMTEDLTRISAEKFPCPA